MADAIHQAIKRQSPRLHTNLSKGFGLGEINVHFLKCDLAFTGSHSSFFSIFFSDMMSGIEMESWYLMGYLYRNILLVCLLEILNKEQGLLAHSERGTGARDWLLSQGALG